MIGPVDGWRATTRCWSTSRTGAVARPSRCSSPRSRAASVAYARVQWQVGHAAGVPEHAQGVGLVILRDFGRWLRGRVPGAGDRGREPVGVVREHVRRRGVQRRIPTPAAASTPARSPTSRAGTGWRSTGWATTARRRRRTRGPTACRCPRPSCSPARRATRSWSRSRATPTTTGCGRADRRTRRSPRAPVTTTSRARTRRAASCRPDAVFGVLGCNGGRAVPMNPMGAGPSVRADAARAVPRGGRDRVWPTACPRSRRRCSSTLGPAPPASEHFNALPGVELRVPVVDADAQPVGGVRFPDVELPLGRAEPVALVAVRHRVDRRRVRQLRGLAAVRARRARRPLRRTSTSTSAATRRPRTTRWSTRGSRWRRTGTRALDGRRPAYAVDDQPAE